MNFSRDTLPQDALTSEPAALCARLNPGQWLIEAQAAPPTAHDPALLPLGDGLMGAVALSLSSGTAIGLSLGPALAERVMALGPSPGPLAGLALHELIVNAVVHGNLHVKSGRSGGWSDITDRQARIAESLADPPGPAPPPEACSAKD